MREEWANKLQRQLEDFGTDAPAGLLVEVKSEMSRRAAARKHRHAVALWRMAAAIVVMASVGVWLWVEQPYGSLRPSAEVAGTAVVGESDGQRSCVGKNDASPSSRPGVRAQIAASGGVLAANGHADHGSKTDVQTEMVTAAVAKAVIGEAVEAASSDGTPAGSGSAMAKKAPAETGRQETAAGSERRVETSRGNGESRTYAAMTVHGRGNGGGRLSLAASYQGNGMSSSSNGSAEPVNALYEAKLPGVLLGDAPGSGGSADVKAKHDQPVRAGVSVRYKLNSRWGLQTGVTYSYLRSSFDVSQNGVSNSTEQSLHYLGVPVAVTCDVWRGGRFGVYALAGGMGEMLVGGTAKSRYEMSGKEWQRQSTRIKDHRVLWSVNAAVGAECNVVKGVALYVEPGCNYHFDNGSDVQSAYTDRRFGFDLNFGLRVNLP